MTFVLSLIAAKSKAALSQPEIDRAARALEAAGAQPGAADWLSPEEACDIPFEGAAEMALKAARAALSGPVDVNAVPAAGRRKRLLLADMDSTLIGQECVDELAAEVGQRDAVAAITERAMRGEIAFEPALRERVALFAGLPVSVIERVIATRITINPGAAAMVATMRAGGAHTALVSGGFTLFTGVIAERLKFHEHRSNTLIAEGERFTGRVAEPILGREAKVEALEALTAALGIEAEAALAVGDGANDSGMIRAAGLGVAYHGKPALREAADAALDHADLTGVLYLQGYRRDEIVGG